jgi:hypothetical protein
MNADGRSPKRDFRDIRLTAAEEDALFRLSFHDVPVEKQLIEQLVSLGIVVRTPEGQHELTQFGKGVYVGLVMAREG